MKSPQMTLLEEALIEYVEKFGLTENARRYFAAHQGLERSDTKPKAAELSSARAKQLAQTP